MYQYMYTPHFGSLLLNISAMLCVLATLVGTQPTRAGSHTAKKPLPLSMLPCSPTASVFCRVSTSLAFISVNYFGSDQEFLFLMANIMFESDRVRHAPKKARKMSCWML